MICNVLQPIFLYCMAYLFSCPLAGLLTKPRSAKMYTIKVTFNFALILLHCLTASVKIFTESFRRQHLIDDCFSLIFSDLLLFVLSRFLGKGIIFSLSFIVLSQTALSCTFYLFPSGHLLRFSFED